MAFHISSSFFLSYVRAGRTDTFVRERFLEATRNVSHTVIWARQLVDYQPDLFVLLAPWSAGGGDREDMALSYVYADSGCVAARWLCVL